MSSGMAGFESLEPGITSCFLSASCADETWLFGLMALPPCLLCQSGVCPFWNYRLKQKFSYLGSSCDSLHHSIRKY